MFRLNKWFPAACAVAGFALLGTPREAHAILALATSVNGTLRYAVDNNVAPPGYTPGVGYTQILDVDPTVGVLSLGAAPVNIGGLLVSGSLHTQTIGSVPGTFNILNSSSLEVANPTGSNITATVAVSATDFQPPVFTAFTTGSGTWETADGSSITLGWYNDPTNGQGAEIATDTPGILVDSFSDTAVGVLDSFSHTDGPFAVSDPAAFSMSLAFSFTLTPGGSLISRGMSEVKPVAIPEPGTLAMAGLALPLLGLGYLRNRRRKAG